ncbi:nuclear transport factor 2 family protein [Nocardioides panzhihuensis]|uniref:Ketosteroid isomerase-like protein n=1 Tax=Nocardioides panzhihuensis TaxID=860243 RepID=A0A7Z0IRH4_9ACTN|nr:nuclear transport factor 2 family protein [Nocardioides panzhihuensis]NYI76833.1 ketosteroid isomerase-like protein [Nocardioides panzhihuensis]
MTEQHSATPIDPADLPQVIITFLAAQQAHDAETAISLFLPDAVVTDEGHDFHGDDKIRDWIAKAASDFTYTTELTGAFRLDATHYDVIHHLEGDFPGGVVDLHFRFAMRDDLIQTLTIEP